MLVVGLCAAVASVGAVSIAVAPASALQDAHVASQQSASVRMVTEATTTTVTADAAADWGTPRTLTAAVSPAAATGTVTFSTGAGAIAGCVDRPLAAGVATCETSSFPVTDTLVTASYSGAAAYDESSGTVTVSSTKRSGAIARMTLSGPTEVGVPFTATVQLAAGTDWTGTAIRFTFEGHQCPANSSADGAASCTFTPTLAGSNFFVGADFAGNVHYDIGYRSITTTVRPGRTVTTASAPIGIVGRPVTITATVVTTDPSGGRVDFRKSNGSLLCTSVALTRVDGVWTATCSTSSLALGRTQVFASFFGGENYQDSGDDVIVTVVKAVPVVSVGPATGVIGQSFDVTANITSDTSTAMAGQPLTMSWAGQDCTVTSDAAGDVRCTFYAHHVAESGDVTVSFAGDTGYSAQSGTARVTIGQAASTTTVQSTGATFGSPATIVATVAPSAATGTVTFTAAGDAVSGCVDVQLTVVGGVGTAECTLSTLPVGATPITAGYTGNADYLESSADGTIIVSPGVTALAYSGDAVGTVARPLTVSATLSSRSAGGAPLAGRDVTFALDGQSCTAPTDAAGHAVCEVTPVKAGDAELEVRYAGDGDYRVATTTAALSIAAAATVTTLDAASRTAFGTPLVLVATVTPSGAGTLSFRSAGAALAGCTDVALTIIDGAGTARCTVDALPVGAHTLEADFAGTPDYLPSAAARPVSVIKATTVLRYAGEREGTVGSPLRVAAELSTAASSDQRQHARLAMLVAPSPAHLEARSVTFRLGDATCVARTDATGRAECDITPASAAATELAIGFEGDAGYVEAELLVGLALAPAPQPEPTAVPTPRPTTAAAAPLASTGVDGGIALAGLLVLLTGLGLALGAQRRRQRAQRSS